MSAPASAPPPVSFTFPGRPPQRRDRKPSFEERARPAPPPRPAVRGTGNGPGGLYFAIRRVSRLILACTMRMKTRGLERLETPGGVLVAVSHVSHLDPAVLSVVSNRAIHWMAREEFYQTRLSAWFLKRVGAFPVNRQGRALPAIREALRRLEAGSAVGIFPEGEIVSGPRSVVRGGRVRRGVALLAARSGCPVLPVIVAGTEKLNAVGPWLPAKRGRLWLAAGDFLHAPPDARSRAGRAAFAAELERAFVQLYGRMRREFHLPEDVIP